jgi:hypothetical protein
VVTGASLASTAPRLFDIAALDQRTAIVQADVPDRLLTYVIHGAGRTWRRAPV